MQFGKAQADKYLDAFFERFEQIAQQPLLYQTIDDVREGYRRSVCRVESIYSRIDGESVEIMAIIGQQDLDDWL